MMRRRTLVAATVAALALVPAAATAQAYPHRPVRLVLTLPPGGLLDLVARKLAEPLSQQLGQPVVIDNRPGAGGNLASAHVAKAAADGHTLLFTTDAVVLNPLIYPNAGYQPRELVPVVGIIKGPQIVSVPAASPYKTLQDVLAAAKANPGTVSYASAGSGQSSHLAGELLKKEAGIELMHVPYKGSGPSLTDAAAGQVHLVISSPASAAPHYASGRLRPLAVTSRQRLGGLPQVPTVAESGVPGYASENWSGIFAPADTPSEVLRLLNTQIAQVLSTPAFQQLIAAQGFETTGILEAKAFQQLVAGSREAFARQAAELKLAPN